MSLWHKFYWSWGALAALLLSATLFTILGPVHAAPYALPIAAPFILALGLYGVVIARCPRCRVHFFEVLATFGPPGRYCTQCGYDLTSPQ
jgi:hypothetical protein